MSGIGNIRPLSGHIGAEIAGLDLRRVGDDQVGALRQALLDHQVLFFPAQHDMGPNDLCDFAARFGTIDPPHPALERHPDNENVFLVQQHIGKHNEIWHSDVTFDREPPMGSVLRAVELPPYGGDTLFASMYAAWETLDPRLQRAIEGLEAIHDGSVNFTTYLFDPPQPDAEGRLARMKAEKPGAVHPLVVRHPETGRKALYINRAFVVRILGVTEIVSRNLIDLLCEHAEQASLQVRWRWSEGDIAFWDNRCTLHYAANDYFGHTRTMHRVTLKGTRPKAA